jgi:hypothetical protein
MLTKKQLIDLVIENKAGGTSPDYKKFHPSVIQKALDLALSQLIAIEVREQQKQGDFVLESSWVKTFEGKEASRVKWDAYREQAYIILPARIISLTRNGGLREISWPQGADMPFQIIDAQAHSVLRNLECSELPAGVFFAQMEGNRVYFPNMNQRYKNRKLTVKMICGSDGYGNDEPLPIPDSRTAEILAMLDKMFDEQKQTRQKMSNDSNPNTM